MTNQDRNIIFDFYQNTQESNFVFTYRGVFSDDLTSRLVDIGESIRENGVVKRKMSFLLVECFQNILRYSENKTKNSNGYFSFRVVDNAFVINSINLVKTKDVASLIQKVTEINMLSSGELKQLYLKRLESGEFNEKGGAGLGLIEIARKSGQELQYKMEEIDDDFYNFHQQVTLYHKGVEDTNEIDLILESEKNYRVMYDNKLLLEYKGDFSRGAILPLLTIIEKNLAERKTLKKVGHVLVEMLQNISKHNSSTNNSLGVCLISQHGDRYLINTGNIIDTKNINDLKSKIVKLNGMSREELTRYHSRRILDIYGQDDDISSELGLIEIAKHSTKKLVYDFETYSLIGKSFFSFYATI